MTYRTYKTRHHNTTNLEGSLLESAEARAKKSEEFVMEVFKARPNKYLGSWDIQAIAKRHKKKWPITSIRRATTNLANPGRGILVRTEIKTPNGPYNELCYKYTLNNKLF